MIFHHTGLHLRQTGYNTEIIILYDPACFKPCILCSRFLILFLLQSSASACICTYSSVLKEHVFSKTALFPAFKAAFSSAAFFGCETVYTNSLLYATENVKRTGYIGCLLFRLIRNQLHAVSRRSYKLFLLKGSRLSQPSFCKSGKNS